MKEGVPAMHKGSAEYEGFVANVKMPQTFSFIKVGTLLGAIEETGFKNVATRLSQSIEMSDPSIESATKKANAQHNYHGIGRELTVADIVRVTQESRGHALNLLEKLVDANREGYLEAQVERPDLIFEEWLDEEVEKYKHKDVILEFLRSFKKAVDSSEVIVAIEEYKDKYRDWKEKDVSEQYEAIMEVSTLLRKARELILSKIKKDLDVESDTWDSQQKNELERIFALQDFNPLPPTASET